MLEKALEEERGKFDKLNKNVTKFLPPCLLIFGVISGFIFFFAPIGVSFGTKLLRWLALIAVLVIVGIIVFLISFARQHKMTVMDIIKSAVLGKKYTEAMKLGTDDKIKWLKATLSKAKTPYEKLNAVYFLIQVYAESCMDNEADECFKLLSQISPKKKAEKIMYLETQLMYYDYKDDAENYLRTYSKNDDILKLKWDMTLSEQLGVFHSYLNYTMINQEFEKSLELYNLALEIHDKAAQINKVFALTDEAKNLCCLDYAMLYCKLGEKEKSAESFRIALERFESTDKPSLRKHLEKVRRMLDEAEIDYT